MLRILLILSVLFIGIYESYDGTSFRDIGRQKEIYRIFNITPPKESDGYMFWLVNTADGRAFNVKTKFREIQTVGFKIGQSYWFDVSTRVNKYGKVERTFHNIYLTKNKKTAVIPFEEL